MSEMSQAKPVSEEAMRAVYEQTKTPYKYGVIVRGEEGRAVDCPNVFRHGDAWYMAYVCMNEVGYETHLARSDDLLKWEPLGKILKFREGDVWDKWQADGGVALFDHTWGGTNRLQTFNDRYWMSYIGGALQGYEPDPLSIGMAWTKTPDRPVEWNRLEQNPVLGPSQPDARGFENVTLYKSNIIWDRDETLGHPFVMYYNGKTFETVDGKKRAVERIGMAVSEDMVHWTRFGRGPVIDNGKGISGDPQIVRMGDLWVMFYFGHVWKPKAFDTFACSQDLVNWTKWDGPHLIEPSAEGFDSTFAHKPWVIKHDGIVYHYYCAVNKSERTIAVATSQDLGSAS